VFPGKGGRIWYDDQRHVHHQIFAGEDELDYAFMGNDPSATDNVWLRAAAECQIPLIYFLGVSSVHERTCSRGSSQLAGSGRSSLSSIGD